MNVPTASDRLKKVMRIALVGIKPGDQVMLKGYMRILLRLEADLEWVSANSQQIDLFMVNNDFRHAESVQKLISNRPNTATIYTSRSETESGYLSQDLLVLPLKDLEPLSQWLFTQVPFLSGVPILTTANTKATFETKDTAKSNNSPAAQAHTPIHRQTSLAGEASQPVNQASQSVASAQHPNHLHNKIAESTHSMATPTSKAPSMTAASQNALLEFANIFSRIQQRQDDVFAIKSPSGTLFAYINPKQQRVWELTEYISPNQPWLLTQADDSAKSQLDVKAAKNMVQWLWELSTKHTQKLDALLDPQISYRIESWVKPLHNADQHDHLKIQCVLEARSVTIDELVQISQCSLPQVKSTLIGLFVAGAFPASVYEQTISKLATADTSQVGQTTQAASASQPMAAQPLQSQSVQAASTTSSQSVPQATNTVPSTQTAPQSKLDELLNRRAMAEPQLAASTSTSTPSTSTNWHTNTTTDNKPTPSDTSNQSTAAKPSEEAGNNGMMGFLGRLRRRLGL